MNLQITSPDISVHSTQLAEWKPLLHPGETGVMMYMLSAAPDIQETIEVLEFVFTCDELEEMICTHTVYVEGREPMHHTRSHKRLYFIAQQYGPLPNVIPVLIFAGYPTEMPWQANGMPYWLDITPSHSATAAYSGVAPNTTSLHIGRYNGPFSIASAAPNSPSDIQVIYDVVDAVDAVPAISESPRAVHLGAAYPNPFTGSTTISYSSETRNYITIDVYNVLGEKVRTLYNGNAAPGQHTAAFNAAGLPDGPYRIVLRSGDAMQSRMVVVSK